MDISNIKERYRNSTKIQELAKGAFWSMLGSFLSKGLIFLVWILIGRILGSEGYGTFGIIRNTAIMFASFAGMGLGITAAKFVAEYSKTDIERASRIIGLTLSFGLFTGVVISIAVFFLSPWIAEDMLHAPALTDDMRICSLILFLNSFNGAQIGALQGLQAFKQIATINVAQSLVSAPVFIAGAYYWGVRGSVWAFAFYSIIVCFFAYIAIRKELRNKNIRVSYSESWKERSVLLSYSFPAFLSGLMVTPLKWISDVIVVNSPNGFHQMGIFTAALTFNVVFLMVVNMLDAPFLAVMSKNKGESVNSQFNRFNIIAPWALGIIVISPFLVFPEIGSWLFGKSYVGNDFNWTFIFVLLFTLIIMYEQGTSRLLAVYNMFWIGVLSNAVWGITLLICVMLLRGYGAVGLGISYVIAYIGISVFQLPIFYKKNLIPTHTIFSKYAAALWIAIILIVVQNILSLSLIIRGILLVLYYILIANIILKYIKQN